MPMCQGVEARMCIEVASRARSSAVLIALSCAVFVADYFTGTQKNAAQEECRGSQNS